MYLDEKRKKTIIETLRKHNVKSASIFGSYARGDANYSSDIDILVKPAKKSLFELAGIKIDLEEKLGCKVDINTYNGLNYSTRKGLKEEVLKDQVRII